MNKFITLPTDFICDTSTTLREKIIIAEIHNLSSLEKGCVASNKHFEILLNIPTKSVSNAISNLVKKSILEIKISDRNHTRIIKIIDKSILDLLSTKSGGVSTKSGGVSTKSGESKENNTINNTVNKKINKKLPITKPSKFEYPREFEAVWKVHSVGDKWRAYRAFAGREKDYSLEELKRVAGLESKKDFAKRHLSTVLNGDIDEMLKSGNTQAEKRRRYV